jgi:hypothetical protein
VIQRHRARHGRPTHPQLARQRVCLESLRPEELCMADLRDIGFEIIGQLVEISRQTLEHNL